MYNIIKYTVGYMSEDPGFLKVAINIERGPETNHTQINFPTSHFTMDSGVLMCHCDISRYIKALLGILVSTGVRHAVW